MSVLVVLSVFLVIVAVVGAVDEKNKSKLSKKEIEKEREEIYGKHRCPSPIFIETELTEEEDTVERTFLISCCDEPCHSWESSSVTEYFTALEEEEKFLSFNVQVGDCFVEDHSLFGLSTRIILDLTPNGGLKYECHNENYEPFIVESYGISLEDILQKLRSGNMYYIGKFNVGEK